MSKEDAEGGLAAGWVRLRLGVQYDGGAFYGWQAQAGRPTVQGCLQAALARIVEHEVKLVGAGRTDRGVHAWGQVAHADVAKVLPVLRYVDGMNRFLPHTIRVVGAEVVDARFHARFGATARHYVYRLWTGRQLRPDLRGQVGHVVSALDFAAMQAAVALMPLGLQDFSAFRDADCQSRVPLCRLLYLRWVREADELWRLEIGANHFLHHMVRNIMGTLVEIGLGRRPVTGLVEALRAGERQYAGMTFAAEGLYLVGVEYGGT